MMFTFGSVCSGIEAASVAWHPLGWHTSFLSEIEPFPRAVLSHHYPETPLHGDFTTIQAGDYDSIDLLVGGTPCQSFSIAGLRGGLADDRGNLALEYLRLADRLRPRWLVWENVPGVLSSGGGRDFGTFLGGVVELGYGFAYRVLDAQYFGVPQRRRRVFVVAYLGDWRRAAAVFFERHSLQGHPAPSRSQGAPVAALTARGVGTCGADDNQGQAGHLIAEAFGGNNTSGPIDVATALNACHTASGRMDSETETFVATTLRARDLSRARGVDSDCTDTLIAHCLRGEGFDASEDGTGRGTPLVPIAFPAEMSATQCASTADLCPALSVKHTTAVAFQTSQSGMRLGGEVHPTLDNNNGSRRHHGAMIGSAVRRLTPRECERLQGFPDDYTLIPYGKTLAGEAKEELARYFEHTGQYMREVGPQKWVFDRERFERAWPKIAADGPRYKALGNSMAVPVMAWIGQRIQMVEAVAPRREAAE